MAKPELSKADQKESARLLWNRGFKADEIHSFLELDVSLRAVFQWIDSWKKDDYQPEQAIFAADNRLIALIQKESKTAMELREMQVLSDLIKTADTNRKNLQAKTFKPSRAEVAANDDSGDKTPRTQKGKKKAVKNDVSHVTTEMFEKFEQTLFWHQTVSLEAAFDPDIKIRMILKPRQHGQTYVEAYIAFKKAVLTAEPCVFLSATISQAMVFKGYINKIAVKFFECEAFVGNPIELSNGGSFVFVSSRVSTAQSRPGHVWFDECAWTYKFKEVDTVANAMATQKQYTMTYLTTPSTTQHDFYEYWTGERVNKYRASSDKFEIDVRVSAFENLDGYRKDPDGVARFLYTVDSAIDKGFDLVTLEQLRLLAPNPAVFDNLYRTAFIDDSQGCFSIAALLRCCVDDDKWVNYERGVGVSVGYDPSSGSQVSGDAAGVSFLEVPKTEKQPFRLLEFKAFTNATAKEHVNFIKERKSQYQIQHFFADTSGSGIYVWQHVNQVFPHARKVTYDVAVKTQMVQKMQDLIREKRFLFHEDLKHEVIAAFMSVKITLTERTGQITYYSTRTGSSHGELFWASAQAALCERLDYDDVQTEIQFFSV